MRNKNSMLILILITCLSIFSEAKNEPLLCSICECSQTNGSFLQTNCSSDITNLLYNTTDTKNNTDVPEFSIQILIIRNNELVTLKEKFPFENLTKLDLSKNKILHIADKVFEKLQKLETLILSYNNIEILQPNSFQGQYKAGAFTPLQSLKTILLDHNNLHSLNADLFEHTEKIETLSLAYNPLKVIDTHTAIAITNLQHLKYLDLSYTGISELPQYFLHTPKFITFLNLSGNAFTEVPQGLKEAHSLETFAFNDNPLKNLTKKNGFPEIPTLRVLHLCQMPELVTIGPSALAKLSNLEELYIAGNSRLSRIDDAALVNTVDYATYEVWPRLRKLYLNDNQLSYLNKTLLAQWNVLAELDLSNNPWVCECQNGWMVETLMPIYMKIDEENAKKLKCAAPVEMTSYTFEELHEKNYNMRCLDYYGARPEKDAALLVGMLAGVLLGIPLVLLCLYAYKRHWFGIFDDSPAAFSRQFYSKTNSDIYEY